ncbi:MAG: 2-hydroxychromene-2-carboxylate isomerase [Burkholderiaceae bacterium]|nr:2-hydroxychromene-2-carboxylate isomerase [Burkholderiaceae bacterium]MCD8516157.1 2-hydroxychromene-2-carboxylate isomerase [Burkholderiaceae bacterium]MCD8566164.1 2-hydroxychromene-2-carboxylate isomerase [Burkholderiaceae bacterium]
MTITIDYYLAPQSPWTYLGHQRLAGIAAAAGAQIRVRPIDLGRVFPVFGGVVLKDRHPKRQAYRLVELALFRDYLNVPLNLEPKFFPVVSALASKTIVAVEQSHGDQAAFKFAGALMSAVWAQERDIADEQTLTQILAECDLPSDCLAQAKSDVVQGIYDRYTDNAIELGVFGAPTYVLDGKMYWGQDRLMFLEQALSKRPA